MNRREFLARMFQAGLVVATPKIIFDMGANSYKVNYTLYEFKNSMEFERIFALITDRLFQQASFFKEFKLTAGLEPATCRLQIGCSTN